MLKSSVGELHQELCLAICITSSAFISAQVIGWEGGGGGELMSHLMEVLLVGPQRAELLFLSHLCQALLQYFTNQHLQQRLHLRMSKIEQDDAIDLSMARINLFKFLVLVVQLRSMSNCNVLSTPPADSSPIPAPAFCAGPDSHERQPVLIHTAIQCADLARYKQIANQSMDAMMWFCMGL